MKITLLNGDTFKLDNTNNIEERMYNVQNVLSMYSNGEIEKSWNNYKTKYMLEGLANYLVWCKGDEDLYKHDKEVLSKNKTKKINKYNSDNIPFSSLSKIDRMTIGIYEVEDYE